MRRTALIARQRAEIAERYDTPDSEHGVAPSAADIATFFVAYEDDGTAVGCGGLRYLGEGVGEIKRMYVAPPWRGSGTAQLIFARAGALGLGSGMDQSSAGGRGRPARCSPLLYALRLRADPELWRLCRRGEFLMLRTAAPCLSRISHDPPFQRGRPPAAGRIGLSACPRCKIAGPSVTRPVTPPSRKQKNPSSAGVPTGVRGGT
ncbi:GNAT family N-acetyltransferase [Streptomyces roseoverticillatus]|uniref:GNAT family N-acetyltransferase n=1 Tax=Streptomyces roseoverticillatus TaxID=66429 RepID=UPI001F347577|nr:GNAT family N-acetyltransferase [Streptomyces roseoverticillatus]